MLCIALFTILFLSIMIFIYININKTKHVNSFNSQALVQEGGMNDKYVKNEPMNDKYVKNEEKNSSHIVIEQTANSVVEKSSSRIDKNNVKKYKSRNPYGFGIQPAPYNRVKKESYS